MEVRALLPKSQQRDPHISPAVTKNTLSLNIATGSQSFSVHHAQDKQSIARITRAESLAEELNVLIKRNIPRRMSWDNPTHSIEKFSSFDASGIIESSLVKIPQVFLDEVMHLDMTESPRQEAALIRTAEATQVQELDKIHFSFEDIAKRFLGPSARVPTEPRKSRPTTGRFAQRPRTSSLLPSSKPSECRALNVSGQGLKQASCVSRPRKLLLCYTKKTPRLETYIPLPTHTDVEQRSPSVQRSDNNDSELLRVDDALLMNYLKDHSVFSNKTSPKGVAKSSAKESTRSLDHSIVVKATPRYHNSPKAQGSRRTGSDFLIKLRQRTPDLFEEPLRTSETPTSYRIESIAKAAPQKLSPIATPVSYKDEMFFQGQTEDSEELLSARIEYRDLQPMILCSMEPSRMIENSTSPMLIRTTPFTVPHPPRYFSVPKPKVRHGGKLVKGRSLKPMPAIKTHYIRHLRMS
jgi:hypothetical protein